MFTWRQRYELVIICFARSLFELGSKIESDEFFVLWGSATFSLGFGGFWKLFVPVLGYLDYLMDLPFGGSLSFNVSHFFPFSYDRCFWCFIS